MNTAASNLKLTKSRIVDEAISFADEYGVGALSMRKLAERLGAGTMSLYTHVANKDDLIAAMIDVVSLEIELPRPDLDWRRSLLDCAASAHQTLHAHPWAAPEWTGRMPGATRLRLMEAILATLTRAGLDDSLVYRGYHAVTMHIVGFTIQELGYLAAAGAPGLEGQAEQFLESLTDADLPHMADHVRGHLEPDSHGDEFEFVLGLILDGLERANEP